MPAVHRKIGTQASHQLDAVRARRGCKHPRSAKLCKLNGERSDAARCCVNDDSLVLPEMERVIDPLESGEPGRSNRAGVLEVKRLGNARDLLCRDSNIRGIETALGIEPAKRINLVADFEPTDPGAHRRDNTGAVATEHEGKPRLAAWIPSSADIRVPWPDARRVERDQNLAWIDFGNGQVVHR